jgi:hypothetical protein
MRCPSCGLDAPAGDSCSACGARLFAWLGDPFGGMELPAPRTAVARHPAAARPRPSNAKLLVAALVIVFVASLSALWATLLVITFLLVLVRWPGLGWLRWNLLLGAFVLMAILSQPAAVRILRVT